MASTEPLVESLEAVAYRIPTETTEADGTLTWTATTMVMAEVAAAGQVGRGYTYAGTGCVDVIDTTLVSAVKGTCVWDIPGTWLAMVRSIRNLGRPGVASCAISAVDMALWDLKARLLGRSLVDVFGATRRTVPVYGSGGFVNFDDDQTRRQLDLWTGDWGIPRVKIKIGQDYGTEEARDIERVALARHTIGPTVALFVDGNGAYRRKQAMRLAAVLDEYDVTWFEEPVSSDDLTGLAQVRAAIRPDVTAGEYGYDLAYFEAMLDAGAVDCLQIDVTRCGGYTEWLRAAALAAARSMDISAHCAPTAHGPVAASVNNLRHIEYFYDHHRIENSYFDGVAPPTGGELTLDRDQPGSGWVPKIADLEQFRVR